MSSSIPTQKPRLLLDENVRRDLFKELTRKNFAVSLPSPGSSDAAIAALSFQNSLVLFTNDVDFCRYTEEQVFSVVWLRIPQNNAVLLIDRSLSLLFSFSSSEDFKGKFIVLEAKEWKIMPLGSF